MFLSCACRCEGTKGVWRRQVTQVYYNAVRWIPLAIDPFVSIPHVVYASIHGEATDEEYDIFQRVLDVVPTFGEVLVAFVEDTDLLGQFTSKVSEYMHCLPY
ncbi:hypothetical protein L208DRAFT_1412702 [Tricholoma matsutake]|nr:hypothetical protein L208DRAFT_1412702 [Tricholoma matsutake 945]